MTNQHYKPTNNNNYTVNCSHSSRELYLEVCGASDVCCCLVHLAEGQQRLQHLGSYCSVPPPPPRSHHTENTWGYAGRICHPLWPRHPLCTHTAGRWLWQRTLNGKGMSYNEIPLKVCPEVCKERGHLKRYFSTEVKTELSSS